MLVQTIAIKKDMGATLTQADKETGGLPENLRVVCKTNRQYAYESVLISPSAYAIPFGPDIPNPAKQAMVDAPRADWAINAPLF